MERTMAKKARTEETQQTMQEKYLEYQMLEQQTKQLQEQLQTVAKQLEELEGIRDAIQRIEKTQKGTEILVPMSSGIFLKTALQDTSHLLVNVGDNVVVPKSFSDALALIKKQQGDIQTFQENLVQNLQLMLMHQQSVEAELLSMVQEE